MTTQLPFSTLDTLTRGEFEVAIVANGRNVSGSPDSVKLLSLSQNETAFDSAIDSIVNSRGSEPAFTAITLTATDTITQTATSDGTFMEGLAQPTGNFPGPPGFCPILVTDYSSNGDASGVDESSVRQP